MKDLTDRILDTKRGILDNKEVKIPEGKKVSPELIEEMLLSNSIFTFSIPEKDWYALSWYRRFSTTVFCTLFPQVLKLYVVQE